MRWSCLSLAVILLHFQITNANEWPLKVMKKSERSCKSIIYCDGPILSAVQRAKLYPDSKEFVDKPAKYSEEEIAKRFAELGQDHTPEKIKKFVEENFENFGRELKPFTPKDWKDSPKFLELFDNTDLSDFGRLVHGKWKALVRLTKKREGCLECATSLISLPYPLVVPGGRFREVYYWDSFWVLEGLFVSEMCDTAKFMIENFKWLIKTYGFIPNGTRIYYLNRSQPPLFASMVKRYTEECVAKGEKNLEWIQKILPYLEQEYTFWMRFRTVDLITADGLAYQLNRYVADTDLPRPESFNEDVQVFNDAKNIGAPTEDLYREVSSACESGLDFTARWFRNGDSGLPHIHTSQLVPVELNSLLYKTEMTIAYYHDLVGDDEKAQAFRHAAERRLDAMDKFLWNENASAWIDYNIAMSQPVAADEDHFYVTNLSPLWHDAHRLTPQQVENIIHKYERVLFNYPGGSPCNEVVTGQQWDFPNIWAPFQYYFIDLFQRMASKSASPEMWNKHALDLAQRFINNAYCGYENYSTSVFQLVNDLMTFLEQFFEKYNAVSIGLPGGGGEYTVQEGFGWTNGLILWILKHYGRELTLPNNCDKIVPMVALRHPNGN